jgi:hypothetical protein
LGTFTQIFWRELSNNLRNLRDTDAGAAVKLLIDTITALMHRVHGCSFEPGAAVVMDAIEESSLDVGCGPGELLRTLDEYFKPRNVRCLGQQLWSFEGVFLSLLQMQLTGMEGELPRADYAGYLASRPNIKNPRFSKESLARIYVYHLKIDSSSAARDKFHQICQTVRPCFLVFVNKLYTPEVQNFLMTEIAKV